MTGGPDAGDAPRGGAATVKRERDDSVTMAPASLPAGHAPLPPPAPPLALEAPLPAIADCEVGEVLGRGGMGVVYCARQVSLDRPVALKMMQRGSQISAAEVERFTLEGQALAKLQHPHIVAIYEVGECGGLPYYLMEFVEGGSLDRRLAGAPLAACEAAQLCETLARTMQFAHDRGIIHRDLKPANVLLTADGAPKITDFGLARRIERDQGQTAAGTILGTPSYMAPEQAGGVTRHVGPAVDIYSLGALFYELLTGRPPFRAETPFETLLQVLSQEPVPPSRLQPRVRRDLEVICLKCLEKSPARRYQRAADLAEDLRRFLDGKPIVARPAPWWERGWKWARRRPASATLIGVSALASGLLIAGGAVHLFQVEALNERLRDEVLMKRRQSERANENLETAVEVVERMMTWVGRDELSHVPHLEQVRRKLLTDALQFYTGFLARNADQPGMRDLVASARVEFADLHRQLGDLPRAEKEYRAALAQLVKTPQHPIRARRAREDLARCTLHLGLVLIDLGRLDEAEAELDRARGHYEQLRRESPDDTTIVRQVARCHNDLALAAIARGQLERAQTEFTAALDLLKDTTPSGARADGEAVDAPDGTADDERRLQHAGVLVNLGALDQRLGRWEDARGLYRQAIERLTSLHENSRGRRDLRFDLAKTHNNLATVSNVLRDADGAEQSYRETLRLADQLAGDFTTVVSYPRMTAQVLENLGMLQGSRGRFDDAEALFRRSARIRETVVERSESIPEDALGLASSWNNLATVLMLREQFADAQQLVEQSLTRQRRIESAAPEQQALLAQTEHLLADVLRARNDSAGAVQHLRRAVEQQRTVVKNSPADVRQRSALIYHIQSFAALLRDRNEPTEADELRQLELELEDLSAQK